MTISDYTCRAIMGVAFIVPIAVAGIGLREVGFVGLLGIYGIGTDDAVAFSLANFGVQLAIAAVGGLVELLRAVRHPKPAAAPVGENGREA